MIKVTDWSSVTGGKELAEISGNILARSHRLVASAILNCSAFMIVIMVRLTEQK
jgi:hypothetical protein